LAYKFGVQIWRKKWRKKLAKKIGVKIAVKNWPQKLA